MEVMDCGTKDPRDPYPTSPSALGDFRVDGALGGMGLGDPIFSTEKTIH